MKPIVPEIPSVCTTPVLIFQSALAAIEAETLAWPDRETGGELFGYFTYAGWPVVHRVVNANASAHRGFATFRPDAPQIDQEGRKLIDTYGLQHLGQWHSHQRLLLTQPSGVDRATIVDAMRMYGLNSFVQVIANIRSHGGADSAMASAYFYRKQRADDCESMRWLVLPGASPISGQEGESANNAPTIQLEPSTVTWAELRQEGSTRPLADSETPIANKALLNRLSEELRLLDATGIVARGRPEGDKIRIDANHNSRRFVVLLGPDFPQEAPIVRQSFEDAPDLQIEFTWTAERRIVELLKVENPASCPTTPGKNSVSITPRVRPSMASLLSHARIPLPSVMRRLPRGILEGVPYKHRQLIVRVLKQLADKRKKMRHPVSRQLAASRKG